MNRTNPQFNTIIVAEKAPNHEIAPGKPSSSCRGCPPGFSFMDSDDVIALGTSLKPSKAAPSIVGDGRGHDRGATDFGPITSSRHAAQRRLEVRDDEGRRRFHGAFTGGFSAGYFNTVGSATGWEGPAAFRSSRDQRHSFSAHDARAYMDDEDETELLGATGAVNSAHAYGGLGEKSMAEGRAVAAKAMAAHAAGPQTLAASEAGDDIPAELLVPTAVPIGKQLLQQLGWRPGQPLGPTHQRRLAASSSSSSSSEHSSKALYGLDPSLESLEALWAAAAARAPELDALTSAAGSGAGVSASSRLRVDGPGAGAATTHRSSAAGLGYTPPPSLLAVIARDGSEASSTLAQPSGRAAALRQLGHGMDRFDDRGSGAAAPGSTSSTSNRLHLASVLSGTDALGAHRGGTAVNGGSSRSSGGRLLLDRLISDSYGEDGDGDDDVVPLQRGAGFDLPQAGQGRLTAGSGVGVAAALLTDASAGSRQQHRDGDGDGDGERRRSSQSAPLAIADAGGAGQARPPAAKRLRLTDAPIHSHSHDNERGDDRDHDHDHDADDDHHDDGLLTFVQSARPLEADISALAARFPVPAFPPGFVPARHAFSATEEASFAAAVQEAAAAAVEREQLLRHGRGAGGGAAMDASFTAAGRMDAAAAAAAAAAAVASSSSSSFSASQAHQGSPASAIAPTKQRPRQPEVQPGLGRAARVVTPWVPARLLLRRCNVADPLSKEARQAVEAAAAMAQPQQQQQPPPHSRDLALSSVSTASSFDCSGSSGGQSSGAQSARYGRGSGEAGGRSQAATATATARAPPSRLAPARTGGLSFTVASEVLDAGAGMESLGVGLSMAPPSSLSGSGHIMPAVDAGVEQGHGHGHGHAQAEAELQGSAVALLRRAIMMQ